MFNIRLVLAICLAHDNGVSVQLTKNIQLPFVPFKGLRFSDERAVQITVVDYFISKEEFFCAVKTLTSYSHNELQHRVDSFTEIGWQVAKDSRVLKPGAPR